MSISKSSSTFFAAAALMMLYLAPAHAEGLDEYPDPKEPALPDTDFDVSLADTALVTTDPQIDFLNSEGVTWKVVGESVTEYNAVENIRRRLDLLKVKYPADAVVASHPHTGCHDCRPTHRYTVNYAQAGHPVRFPEVVGVFLCEGARARKWCPEPCVHCQGTPDTVTAYNGSNTQKMSKGRSTHDHNQSP